MTQPLLFLTQPLGGEGRCRGLQPCYFLQSTPFLCGRWLPVPAEAQGRCRGQEQGSGSRNFFALSFILHLFFNFLPPPAPPFLSFVFS